MLHMQKRPKCPTTAEWIKSGGTYISIMEYCSAIKKKEIFPFATAWTDLEDIMPTEISQRKIPYDFTYMWNLKNKTNKIETDTENRLMIARGRSETG